MKRESGSAPVKVEEEKDSSSLLIAFKMESWLGIQYKETHLVRFKIVIYAGY